MYITPTNKDQEGKKFILTVTGNRWTENQWGEGKRDLEVLNDETNSNDVLVLTEGWFKDNDLENIKKGDKLTISFDKSSDDWFNVKIESDNANGHSTTYLDHDEVARIDDKLSSRQEQIKLEKKIVAEGQVRFGFSKEAFRMGLELDEKTKKRIESFTDYVMNPRYKQDTPQEPPPHTDEELPF
jgi:hypothetical protein